MSVAIRRRSWEEHGTHKTGLQYSYDDLDIVCYTVVASGGSAWTVTRRTRCASLPVYQLPQTVLREPSQNLSGEKSSDFGSNSEDACSLDGEQDLIGEAGCSTIFLSQEDLLDSDSACEPEQHHSDEEAGDGEEQEITAGDHYKDADDSSIPALQEQEKNKDITHDIALSRYVAQPEESESQQERPKEESEKSQENTKDCVAADRKMSQNVCDTDCSESDSVTTQEQMDERNDDTVTCVTYHHSCDVSHGSWQQHMDDSISCILDVPQDLTNDCGVGDWKERTLTEDISEDLAQDQTVCEESVSDWDMGADEPCRSVSPGFPPCVDGNVATEHRSYESVHRVRDVPECCVESSVRELLQQTPESHAEMNQDQAATEDGAGHQQTPSNTPSAIATICETPCSEEEPVQDNIVLPGCCRTSSRQGRPHIRKSKERECSAVTRCVTQDGGDEQDGSHLDSMLLLMMKLDQLDKDIDIALRETSSVSAVTRAGLLSVPKARPTSRTRHSSKVTPARADGQKNKEAEAQEACSWLRAAGFPQYAQLYEDGQFPINISSVTWDHDFLDRDAIEALCRRLNTLNKCAMMRLEISPQRKRSEDSDEDEPCAISGRWTFQRDSKRWSRLEELEVFRPASPAAEARRGSADSGTTSAAATRAGSVPSVCSSGTSAANEDSASEGLPSPSPTSPAHFPFDSCKPGGKSARSKARSFLRRIESLRPRGASTRRKKKGQSKLEISGPVLQQGPDEERLRMLNCVDISGVNRRVTLPRDRSLSYCAHGGSSQSEASCGGSSQSEASGSGGSAVSTPSPVTRARSHSAAAGSGKRSGMYLEDFDPLSLLHLQFLPAQAQRGGACRPEPPVGAEEGDEEEMVFFFIPEGHKPGTFPKALRSGGPCPASDAHRGSLCRRASASSLDSRLSFYDNVPPQDDQVEEDVLQGAGGLRRLVDTWAERGGEEGDSDSALDSASPCPSSPLQSPLEEEEAENGSDLDSTGNPLADHEEALGHQDRRDSGVEASLTRANRPLKMRWPSFQSCHQPGASLAPLQLDCQSVLQMNVLQKFSLLRLTALLEKHTPANKHGLSWAVPKFMKRTKMRDYKGRSVFGVPLQVNVQRTGQPLPKGIQQAMRFLRSQCLDQVGLFRKSGVKSRIQALRQMNEASPDGVSYEGQSAYDVADMLKQYFRDLPEPLLTGKLGETLLQIYQYIPKEQRLQAAKAAVLLLPEENRQALRTLLCFLADVAAAVADNQMTCTNLAVCLAPSLFHLSSSWRMTSRKQNLGKPDQRDLNENLAATQGLAHMIAECKKLFTVSEEMSFCQNSYLEQDLSAPQLHDLEPEEELRYLGGALESLLKEAKEKFRGYDSMSTPEHAELACKKVQDGCPLRVWKASVEVPASPDEVLSRLLHERQRWDEDLLDARVVETLDPRTEVYQYVQDSMAPQPPRDYVLLRTWATDLPKGASALVCSSVEHRGAAPAGVRANVLMARYYMEPLGSNRSRLTYLSRMDCRGHCPEWYNKAYGQLCAAEVARIRDSFNSPLEK